MPADVRAPPLPAAYRWRDRLLDARDKLVASRRFQRWVTAFPPTRPIAKRQARLLFDLCAGFVYSQVLFACVRLRLFDRLAGLPQTPETLAPALSLPVDATRQLLEAATALGLTAARGGGRYGLGMLGAALRANPGVAAMIEHHELLYGDLADPVALLRGPAGVTRMAAYWPYAQEHGAAALGGAEVGAYTALMGASQNLVADEVLGAYDLGRHRCLLDVGGGDGSFLAAAARRASHLDLILFDLPAVTAAARQRLQHVPETQGLKIVGGDFLNDPLPKGADVVSLVRVLHDQDDARALRVLRAVHDALAPGGTLLIAEPLAGAKGAAPVQAYFSFYFLAMGRGRLRRPDEVEALLAKTGFTLVARPAVRTPLLAGLIVARRSGPKEEG
jgi:demethylspheroidene O-methyltransferase